MDFAKSLARNRRKCYENEKKLIQILGVLFILGGTFLASNHIKALGMDAPITTITTKISSVRVYNRFVGISSLTPYWANASSYTISSGRTLSASGSSSYQGTGFTLSASITKSVSVTISANKSKLSKLGIWVDTTLTPYKVVQYMYGSPVRTAYKVTSAPFNYYVRVDYK